jgi:hypothetical protein
MKDGVTTVKSLLINLDAYMLIGPISVIVAPIRPVFTQRQGQHHYRN